MLLNDLCKVMNVSDENVMLYSGDEIASWNCIGNYSDQRVEAKVNYRCSEVVKIEMGIVKGVDDKPTLNILIKEQ